jgi:uncharacterized protein (DUF1684 family)
VEAAPQEALTWSTELQLLDWKRRVFELYAEVRRAGEPQQAWERWKAERDELFVTHPQSPIPAEDRRGFSGLPYFPYTPAARVLARVEAAPTERYDIQTSGEAGESYGFTRFATATFELSGDRLSLELYWLDGYGGGVFLPFRDGTSGSETYGAGRYLLDTVKGSDLGMEDGGLVLDFNFAYNPSCAYDPKWVCPLAPLANRLKVPIRAGERYDAKKPG